MYGCPGVGVQLSCLPSTPISTTSTHPPTHPSHPSNMKPPHSGYSLTQNGLMNLQRLANLSALSVSSCPAISTTVLAEFNGRRTAAAAAAAAGSGIVAPAVAAC